MTHHKISASTLARTAALALALTNQVLSAVGKPMLPIESAQLEQLISSGPDRCRRPRQLVEQQQPSP